MNKATTIILALIIGIIIGSSIVLFLNSENKNIKDITGFTIFNQENEIKELNSPQDRIKEDQIKVYDKLVIIHINNSELIKIADSNSMDPLIDKESNIIQLKPKSPSEIKTGDIITYNNSGEIIIHRIIDIKKDKEGKYYVLKGDNSKSIDNIKIRFSEINGIVTGIIY